MEGEPEPEPGQDRQRQRGGERGVPQPNLDLQAHYEQWRDQHYEGSDDSDCEDFLDSDAENDEDPSSDTMTFAAGRGRRRQGGGGGGGEEVHQPTATMSQRQVYTEDQRLRQRQRQLRQFLQRQSQSQSQPVTQIRLNTSASSVYTRNLKLCIRVMWIILAGMIGWLSCKLYYRLDPALKDQGVKYANQVFSIFRDLPSAVYNYFNLENQKLTFYEVLADHLGYGKKKK